MTFGGFRCGSLMSGFVRIQIICTPRALESGNHCGQDFGLSESVFITCTQRFSSEKYISKVNENISSLLLSLHKINSGASY